MNFKKPPQNYMVTAHCLTFLHIYFHSRPFRHSNVYCSFSKSVRKHKCQNHRKKNFHRSVFHIRCSGWLLFINRTIVRAGIKLEGHEIRSLIRWPQIDVLRQLAITTTVTCSSSGTSSPRPCCPPHSRNYWLTGNASYPRICETTILWHICDLYVSATII
jgi:hypothetical protein